MYEQLRSTFSALGKPLELLETADGTRALVLQHGARVLGLFSADNDENFLWTNPALANSEQADEFYASSDWHNSGGDRIWLAPELDLFFPQYPSLEVYVQPRSVDPGNYVLLRNNSSIELINRAKVRVARTAEEIEVKIEKHISMAPNPLRYEREIGDIYNVQYAGYTQHASLSLSDSSQNCKSQVGLWSLLQLPHGGKLQVATRYATEPRRYFGSFAPDSIEVEDSSVGFRMNLEGVSKIGVRAAAVTGKAGYIYKSGDMLSLVIRNFFVDPSGEYIDVPFDETDDLGYAFQACSVNSPLFGRFSELEYHAPAIGGNTGKTMCADTSSVWAFRGPEAAISRIVKMLLG